VHKPILFTKETDASTLYLYKAVTSGQTLKSIEIKWYKIDDAGKEKEYFNTKLENVKVVGVTAKMLDIARTRKTQSPRRRRAALREDYLVVQGRQHHPRRQLERALVSAIAAGAWRRLANQFRLLHCATAAIRHHDHPRLLSFLRRLNDHCARALADAASLCETRAHRDIEVEHWLIKLMEQGEGDLLAILRRYELDIDGIWNGLLAAVDHLPHGLRGKPGLSQRLGQWLEAAWMRASLESTAPV
jgi:hypothetical protein